MIDEEIITLLSHLMTSLHKYQTGDFICTQNESFSKIGIILEGKLQCQKNYLTQEVATTHILKEGGSFGEDVICACCNSMPYSLQALQDTTLLLIDGSHLLFMNRESSKYMSKFLINVIKIIAKRSIHATTQIDYSRIPSLKKRVAVFLLKYYEETGQYIFTISLNRAEMANYLSVTRPALSRVLSELKKEEIIDYYKDTFKIKNLTALNCQ